MSSAYGYNPAFALGKKRKEPMPAPETYKPTATDVQPQLMSAPSATPSVQPRATSERVQGFFDMLQSKMNEAPVTADSVMGTQEYKDLAGAVDFTAGQAQAGLRRDLASRGMLRSTTAVQSLASSDAYYTAQKQALIPKLMESAEARRQQGIQNAATLLSQAAGMENTAFNQGLSQFQTEAPYKYLTKGQQQDKAFNEAEITGRYVSPEIDALLNTVYGAKGAYEAGKAAGKTDAELQGYRAQADAARAALSNLGVDADKLVGAGVTTEQARANRGQAGIETPQAKRDKLMMENEQLKLDIAKDPKSGLAAQASQKMRENEKTIELLDAQIASTYALAEERREPKQTQAEKAAETQRGKTESSVLNEFNVSQPAAEAWSYVMQYMQSVGANGKQPSQEEAGALLDQLAVSGKVNPEDADFLRAYFHYTLGGAPWASETVNMRRKKPREEE